MKAVAIFDSHLHLITADMLRRQRDRLPAYRQKAVQAATVRGKSYDDRLAELDGKTLEDHARYWLAEFDAAGVEAGAFIAVGEANEELAAFVALNPRRLFGWGSLADPRHPDAARTVARFRALGLSGLKLYPPIQRFHANDRILYPVYEAAAEHGLPILFHFGITVGSFYDLTYANPLSLSAPVKEFPEVTFIIAHFGAGFLRETLFLAYHTENVCVDTSGTNNWRDYSPGAPSLEQVFRDALRAYGPRRILFGTDSTVWGGYRHHILREQADILARLELSDQDRQAILRDNARRLLARS
ncbi:MAG: amidohydrolase family protein [Armatimonadota bacterium]|nr:amidohydrolase family protein [Armatimonadota bacterium]MDR7471844.1 amidohydrolase family protein [Armatimonadota bacterium]MDR7508085.1 amidohydrolase family protein [Armatimonadota bacterium]MDR7510337.1 amidohydrolase family protein [Armatimonadota bacterium]MDR7515762.1 amidohydrolase family protein [Armatimonadota bacterium]